MNVTITYNKSALDTLCPREKNPDRIASVLGTYIDNSLSLEYKKLRGVNSIITKSEGTFEQNGSFKLDITLCSEADALFKGDIKKLEKCLRDELDLEGSSGQLQLAMQIA